MRKIFFLLLFLCFFLLCHLGECRIGETTGIPSEQVTEFGPWFTGPLLTPPGNVVPAGYIDVEPYLYEFVFTGNYNNNWRVVSSPNFYTLNPQLVVDIGLTSFMDLLAIPQFYYNYTEGQSDTVLADTPVALNFQILREKQGKWYPAIKFSIREIFPTGKYQKLNPRKKATDFGGTGSFITGAGFVFERLFHFSNYYLSSRLSVSYNFPAPVHVKGFNAFGGTFNTDGTVYPGNFFVGLVGLELSLTKNWVLALDITNYDYNKTRFSGKNGNLSLFAPSSFRPATSNRISLAPAIEYNFNEKMGIIAGSWFTVAGRNASQFYSGVIAFNYYNSIK